MPPSRIEIERLLPAVFQRALGPDDRENLLRWASKNSPEDAPLTPLAALLDVMRHGYQSVERGFDRFAEDLDPDRARNEFLPMLARWLHVDRAMAPDEAALRALLRQAARLWRLRGTERGLSQALETVLGPNAHHIVLPEVSYQSARHRRHGGRFETFHIMVRVRPRHEPYRDALERIIDAMKPAHVSHSLRFDL